MVCVCWKDGATKTPCPEVLCRGQTPVCSLHFRKPRLTMTCHALWVNCFGWKQHGGRIGRFCDYTASNREKVMVLVFMILLPIQFELNTQKTRFIRGWRVEARCLGIFLGRKGEKHIKFLRLSKKNNLLKLPINPKIKESWNLNF